MLIIIKPLLTIFKHRTYYFISNYLLVNIRSLLYYIIRCYLLPTYKTTAKIKKKLVFLDLLTIKYTFKFIKNISLQIKKIIYET